MKILSNDCSANLPMNSWPIKGGLAKFARLFSKLLVKGGHEWVGLIDVGSEDCIGSRLVVSEKNRRWWEVKIPKNYFYENFSNIKKYKDPKMGGRALIDEIKKIITSEQPDLVFLNGSWGYIWAILIAARECNIPIVALHAGILGIEVNLYSDYYTAAGMKIFKEIETDFATLPNYNVFLNETSKDYFVKNIFKIPKAKIKIIPLPCADEKVSIGKKVNKVIDKKTPINVGIVARWDRIKNHQAFLEVAEELTLISNKYKFFSITTIPNTSAKKEFKDRYRKLIKVIEPMEQKELTKFYKKMNFMLLPSIFDVSPHVVLEASQVGVPTFISKNVGYAKLFKDNGLENFIINFSVPKKAAQLINKNNKKKFTKKFINLLKNLHDPKNVMNKYESLFKEIKL